MVSTQTRKLLPHRINIDKKLPQKFAYDKGTGGSIVLNRLSCKEDLTFIFPVSVLHAGKDIGANRLFTRFTEISSISIIPRSSRPVKRNLHHRQRLPAAQGDTCALTRADHGEQELHKVMRRTVPCTLIEAWIFFFILLKSFSSAILSVLKDCFVSGAL